MLVFSVDVNDFKKLLSGENVNVKINGKDQSIYFSQKMVPLLNPYSPMKCVCWDEGDHMNVRALVLAEQDKTDHSAAFTVYAQ